MSDSSEIFPAMAIIVGARTGATLQRILNSCCDVRLTSARPSWNMTVLNFTPRHSMIRWRSIVLLSCVLTFPALAQKSASKPSALLPWSQQLAVREQWLAKRHEMILPMMRKHQIDMWIVVNEEFHDDPLTEYIAPPRPFAGNRDYFVFMDTGEKGLRKIAITGFSEENLKKFFESPDEPRPADKVLPELYEQYKPKKIALSYGARRGVQRSITHDTYNLITDKMGADAAQHFVPAADLI